MRSSCPFPLPMLNCFLQSNFKITHSAGLPPLLLDYCTALGCISHHQEVFPDSCLEFSFLCFCSVVHSYVPLGHSKQYVSLFRTDILQNPPIALLLKTSLDSISYLPHPQHCTVTYLIIFFSSCSARKVMIPLCSSSYDGRCSTGTRTQVSSSLALSQSHFLSWSGDRHVFCHIYVVRTKVLQQLSLLLHLLLLLVYMFTCVAQTEVQHRLLQLIQLEWDTDFLF